MTLPDAKAALGIGSDYTDDDDELQDYLDGIGTAVEEYKGVVVEQREVSQKIWLRAATSFVLSSVPVISLTSVDTVDGSRSWQPDGFDVDEVSGLVTVLSGSVTGRVTATYDAGYAEVPANIKRGALVILQHVWETQRGVGSVQSGVVGSEEVYDPRFSYSVPRKALEWLGSPLPGVA
ncbi:MAG: hypothetical protein ACRDMV_17975 [Streptosporangiales bacterium]